MTIQSPVMNQHQSATAGSVLEVVPRNEVTDDELRDQLRNIPKAELHLHLGGAIPEPLIRQWMDESQNIQLTDLLNEVREGTHYDTVFQKVFPLIGSVINSPERVEKGVVELCKQLAADGTKQVELRTGLKDFGSGHEEYLKAVLEGMKRGRQEHDVDCRLLVSVRRDTSSEVAQISAQLAYDYRHSGIVGMDLSGHSTTGDASGVLEALMWARSQHLPIALHLGESPEETPFQQMRELVLLNPKRLGHCVHLCDEAKAWIKRNRTPMEMCLHSAFMTGMVHKIEDHPLLGWLHDGHPVIPGTDDPLLFGAWMTDELFHLAKLTGKTVEQIQEHQELILRESFFPVHS